MKKKILLLGLALIAAQLARELSALFLAFKLKKIKSFNFAPLVILFILITPILGLYSQVMDYDPSRKDKPLKIKAAKSDNLSDITCTKISSAAFKCNCQTSDECSYLYNKCALQPGGVYLCNKNESTTKLSKIKNFLTKKTRKKR